MATAMTIVGFCAGALGSAPDQGLGRRRAAPLGWDTRHRTGYGRTARGDSGGRPRGKAAAFFQLERGNMPSAKRTISLFWEDHRRAILMAAVTWGLLLPVLSLAVAAEPLKVGALPVT